MTRRAGAILVALIAVLGACSSDDGGDLVAYCAGAADLDRLDDQLLALDADDPATVDVGLERFVDQLAELAEDAPAEIDDDVTAVHDWLVAVVDARAEVVGDEPLTAAGRFQAAIAALDDPSPSLARMVSHARRECGVDF